MVRIILAAGLVGLGLASAKQDEGFVPLFDGKSLDGWVQKGGKAKYTVVGDNIVGKPMPDTPNSFLCTVNEFQDFIFEFEFKVTSKLNSGIQFRSLCFDQPTEFTHGGKTKKIEAGRVHGYQYEIDPSDRAFTAGVYDEGRRGWLANLEANEAARLAFKANAWNKGRIECNGPHIKTWINGVQAADLADSETKIGFIALQVHSIGKKNAVGEEVRWRNLRIKELPKFSDK